MLKKIKSDEIIFYLAFIFVLSLFTSVFVLSFIKIVNSWTFSQAHVNYFNGYLKRGLFGTLMLSIEQITNISAKKIFFFFFYNSNYCQYSSIFFINKKIY